MECGRVDLNARGTAGVGNTNGDKELAWGVVEDGVDTETLALV